MGAPWPLCEGRLVQTSAVTSAANATSVNFPIAGVPDGKVRIIIGFSYTPSVGETKIVHFGKICKSGTQIAILNPISLALNPMMATFIEQGMEYFLLPGEYLYAVRDSATAGSTMTISMEFVDIDLPLYTYDEPQVVKQQDRAMSSIRQRLGGARGSVVRAPSDLGGDRGGRTGPLPK